MGWLVITYGFFKISIILADRGFPDNIVGCSLWFVNISFILCVSETDLFHYLNRNINNKCNIFETDVTLAVSKAVYESVEQQNKTAETHLGIFQYGSTP